MSSARSLSSQKGTPKPRKLPRQRPIKNTLVRRLGKPLRRKNSHTSHPSHELSPSATAPHAARVHIKGNLPRQFQHTPLCATSDALRLVKIRPKKTRSSTIHCDLVVTDLKIDPAYTALSYMWGDDNDQQLIYINDSPFYVRKTLWEFLRYAQNELPNKKLWIDGLCIDQDATKERNHQVRIMGKIYQNARSVVVWLGLVDHSARAFLDQFWEGTPPISPEEFAKGVMSVAQLPYWSRTWVAQEIFHAQDIILCFDVDNVDWSMFWSGIKRSADDPFWSTITESDMYQHRARRARRVTDEDNLGNCLKPYLHNALASGNCMDVRDRIYSLLSVVHKGEKFDIDYAETREILACRAWLHFADPLGSCTDYHGSSLLGKLLKCLEIPYDQLLTDEVQMWIDQLVTVKVRGPSPGKVLEILMTALEAVKLSDGMISSLKPECCPSCIHRSSIFWTDSDNDSTISGIKNEES